MPKGCKGAKSTTRSVFSYECPGCHRIFTSKNNRLSAKLVKLHSKKCNEVIYKPRIRNVMSSTLKNHCEGIISSSSKYFVGDVYNFSVHDM